LTISILWVLNVQLQKGNRAGESACGNISSV